MLGPGARPQDSLDRIVPEGRQYRHLDEGMDDMPAHVKSSLMGASLTVPIQHGRLALGTWQVCNCRGAVISLSRDMHRNINHCRYKNGDHGQIALPQGIYLNEHRNYGGPRQIVVTIQGQRR